MSNDISRFKKLGIAQHLAEAEGHGENANWYSDSDIDVSTKTGGRDYLSSENLSEESESKLERL